MISLTPPRLEGRSLPGSPRHVTDQLSGLRPVGIVPLGRDVDLLTANHRYGIGHDPRADEDRGRIAERTGSERGEVLALQLLQLHLGRHEPRGEHAALGQPPRSRRDHRRDRQDSDRQERQREDDLDQAESGAAAARASSAAGCFHGAPHWTVTIPVGRTIDNDRTYPSEFVNRHVPDWLALPFGKNVVIWLANGFVVELVTMIHAAYGTGSLRFSVTSSTPLLLSSSYHPNPLIVSSHVRT